MGVASRPSAGFISVASGASSGAGTLIVDPNAYKGETGFKTSDDVLATMRPQTESKPYDGHIPSAGEPGLAR